MHQKDTFIKEQLLKLLDHNLDIKNAYTKRANTSEYSD